MTLGQILDKHGCYSKELEIELLRYCESILIERNKLRKEKEEIIAGIKKIQEENSI